jgi:hypothetical protein
VNRVSSIISRSGSRQILTWVGGAVVACATGRWVMVTYDGPKIVCAQGGSVAAGRNITGNTFSMNAGNAGGSGPAGMGSGVASCADASKK